MCAQCAQRHRAQDKIIHISETNPIENSLYTETLLLHFHLNLLHSSILSSHLLIIPLAFKNLKNNVQEYIFKIVSNYFTEQN